MYISKSKDMKKKKKKTKQNAKVSIVCCELDRLIKLLNNNKINITREEIAEQLCEIVEFVESV